MIPFFISFGIFVGLGLLTETVDGITRFSPERVRTRFIGQILETPYSSGRRPTTSYPDVNAKFTVGQEVRFRSTLQTLYDLPKTRYPYMTKNGLGFNASTFGSTKFRVIPAYANRAASGTTTIRCKQHLDYWQEIWGMTSATYGFGHRLITQGYVTFTVPPFPFRVCMMAVVMFSNVTTRNVSNPEWRTFAHMKKIPTENFRVVNTSYLQNTNEGVWDEYSNLATTTYFVNRTAPYAWTSSSTMYEGDYAGIKILQNGYNHPFYVPENKVGFDTSAGDSLKLVPAGFPCTYEKYNHREYCGYNRVTLRGKFHNQCIREGSVQHGILRVGTNRYNPFSMNTYSSRILRNLDIADGEDLVGYTQLPKQGSYDICYSPRARRIYNVSNNRISPVWWKIFKYESGASACDGMGPKAYRTTCRPATRLVITANADTLRWSTTHLYPGTWGTIRIYEPSGSTVLNTNPATAWEHSSPREFYTTVGGDQFRLIETYRAVDAPITYGSMYYDASGVRYKALRSETFVKSVYSDHLQQQYLEYLRMSLVTDPTSRYGENEQLRLLFIGTPDLGTQYPHPLSGSGGCWYWQGDNYGEYSRTLNGINSNMLTTCCSVGSLTYCKGGSTTCSMNDLEFDGVRTSADLGSNPRSHPFAWTHNTLAASEAYAYIRFPTFGNWNVCYRRAGTENWRIIPRDNAAKDSYFAVNMFSGIQLNYSYHVNDSQALTWGPVFVRDPNKRLTTLNHNYNTAPTAVAQGSSIKLVKYYTSCYTDAGETETFNSRPGLQECEVGFCGGKETCANCPGQSSESALKRYEIVFYIRMPKQRTTAGEYYRVCFRNLDENWIQLRDNRYISHSLMASPWKFNTRPEPSLDFTLRDTREGTWGKLMLRRKTNLHTQAFNIDANNVFGSGDVVRFVPNRTLSNARVHCDVTWGATSGDYQLQNFVASNSNWDFGIMCLATSVDPTSKCYSGKIAPSDPVSGTIGTFPYTNVDSTADGSTISDFATQGAVAFIKIPPSLPYLQSYRVCYKPQASNWIELQARFSYDTPSPFIITRKPLHVFQVGPIASPVNLMVAGQYGYVEITGDVVLLDYDVVKLVLDSTGMCDRPAAGTLSANNMYISMTTGGYTFVSVNTTRTNTNTVGSRGQTTQARAYMTFPTISAMNATTTLYKVCYMTRSTSAITDYNWQWLGTISVYSTGIAYTAENKPYNSAVLSLRFLTTGANTINTMPEIGDSAKLIAITSPCFGPDWTESNRPLGINSSHVGLEYNAVVLGTDTYNQTLLEAGLTDLGPTNLPATTVSRVEVTLPSAATSVYYKVCYRLVGFPWIELNQAPLALQMYPLGSTNVYTADAGISTYRVASNLFAQVPFPNAKYAGTISYTTSLLAGAATAGITDATTNTSYLYITHKAYYANALSDEIKLVTHSDEVSTGVFVPRKPGVNCNSQGVVTVNPGVGTYFVLNQPARVSFAVNLPTTSGRYLLCYRRVGMASWMQLEPDSVSPPNPLRILSTKMRFHYDKNAGNYTIRDYYTDTYNGKEYVIGSLSQNDRILIVNNTDVCGLAHGYAYNPLEPNSATSLAASFLLGPVTLYDATGQNVSATRTATVAAPTSPSWYKVCINRVGNTTTVNGTIPFVVPGWYQLPNGGGTELINGQGTPFFVTSKPVKLKILNCPNYNSTRAIRTGYPADITVGVVDANDVVMPFALGVNSYLITAEGANTPFAMNNVGGACGAFRAPQYGWPTQNLQQWVSEGIVTYSLAITTGCPTEGCAITFSASNSIRAPGTTGGVGAKCVIFVKKTPIYALKLWSGGATCVLDESCDITLAALWADLGLAHTATDVVTVSSPLFQCVLIRVNGFEVLSNTTVAVGAFASGFTSISFTFDVTVSEVLGFFMEDKVLPFLIQAGGKTYNHTITLLRPKLNRVVIADVYPDYINSTWLDSDRVVRTAMTPSWEATGYGGRFPHEDDKTSDLTAAPGYHMVALQAYTAILRPLDSTGRFITRPIFLAPYKSILVVNNDNAFTASNRMLRICWQEEACDSGMLPVSFESVKQPVTFRFRNAAGCGRDSPCTINFKFDGADLAAVARITTPVRSLASQLRVLCWNGDQSISGAYSNSCPPTTVESGVTLRIEAVDPFGRVDEYFEGNVFAVMKGGTGLTAANGINVTTVAALLSGVGTFSPVPFVAGVAVITRMTLTRPCTSGCVVQLVTDWGTNVLNLGQITVTPTTEKITCKLITPLQACAQSPDFSCNSVAGAFFYDSNTMSANKASLIYKDTSVCVTVTAVNAKGQPTLYETNWVMYYPQNMDSTAPVTMTDASQSPSRVRPLIRGNATFCFKVDSPGNSKAFFNVRFTAQRFNDPRYWATTEGGECSVGTFKFVAKKQIAGLLITRVTEPLTVTAGSLPSSTVNLFGQRPDAERTTISTTFAFAYTDHYGATISPADMDTVIHRTHHVIVSSCIVTVNSSLSSSCFDPSSSTDVSGTNPLVVRPNPAVSMEEGGHVTATLIDAKTSVVGGVESTYTIQWDRWCLGCSVKFKVGSINGDYQTKLGISTTLTPTATVNLYLLIHANAETRLFAFMPRTSPWRYWYKYEPGRTTPDPGSPAMFKDTCFTKEKASCNPPEVYFFQAVCSDRVVGSFGKISTNKLGDPIQAYVVSATSSSAVDSVYSEPQCGAQADCTAKANVLGQVDILNSWTVSMDLGGFVTLQCLRSNGGAPCDDDLTSRPKQNVVARGATVVDVIKGLIAASYTFPSTKFLTQAVTASDYYALSGGLLTKSITPTNSGKVQLTVEALAPNTQKPPDYFSTNGYILAIAGPPLAQRFRILPVAKESACPIAPIYKCHGTRSPSCQYTGYQRETTLNDLEYSYIYNELDPQTIVPINTDISITVQVEDGAGVRIATAKGSVAVEVYSWSGCNNGGTMWVRGAIGNRDISLDNGRAVATLAFTSPCERCIVRFVLTPDSSQKDLYAELNTNYGQLTQYSAPINVRDIATGAGTHIIVTTPALNQRPDITIADKITLNMMAIRSFGGNRMAVDNRPTGEIKVYNWIDPTTSPSKWVFGNGGVLRADDANEVNTHHGVSRILGGGASEFSATFMFTRTCSSCRVIVRYSVNGNLNSFFVQTATGMGFTVSAVATKFFVVGYRPRLVDVGEDVYYSVWRGAEGTKIPFAGFSSKSLTVSAPTKVVEDNINGDGGAMTVQSYVFNRTEIHRVSFTRSCNRMRVSFGSDSAFLATRTKATRLRVELVPGTRSAFDLPMVNDTVQLNVYAVDDFGFIDVSVGGYAAGNYGSQYCCFTAQPLKCPSKFGIPTTADSSADGVSPGGFALSTSTLSLSSSYPPTLEDSTNAMIDGIAYGIKARFLAPMRNVYPLFSIGSGLTSRGGPTIDVSAGLKDLSLSVVRTPLIDDLTMFTPFIIEAALTTPFVEPGNVVTTSFAAVNATNIIRLNLSSSCPNLLTTTTNTTVTSLSAPLNKGYVKFTLVFTGATSSRAKCSITVEVLPGNGICRTNPTDSCRATVTLGVQYLVATKWFWINPSNVENGGLQFPAGAAYGAMNRQLVLRMGLLAKINSTHDQRILNCDDSSTPNVVEKCTLTVSVAPWCAYRPVIGTQVWNLTVGTVEIPVTWPESSNSSYSCVLDILVNDGSKNLDVDSVPGAHPLVTLCKPTRLTIATNISTVYANEPYWKAGKPYTISVAVLDSTGKLCIGDSGDDGTLVSVDLVGSNYQPLNASLPIDVYNVNTTTGSLKPFTPSSPRLARTVGGIATFGVVITNSSINLGIPGIRLRFTAVYGLQQNAAVLFSPPLDTIIQATTLRFQPNFGLPTDWVLGRPLPPLRVQAVDGVNSSIGPNIPRQDREMGSNALVSWTVDPLPTTGGFPMTFSLGDKEMNLVRGEASYAATFRAPADGVYTLGVASKFGPMDVSTPPQRVNFQTPSQLLLTTNSNRNLTTACTSTTPCGVTFSNNVLNLVGAGTTSQYLNTSAVMAFTAVVTIVDKKRSPVLGESIAYVVARINRGSGGSSVSLSMPPSYVMPVDEIGMFAVNGVVSIPLAFVGTTRVGSTTTNTSSNTSVSVAVHNPCTVEFYCPAMLPDNVTSNPCVDLRQTITTIPIRVQGPPLASTAFVSKTVTAQKPVLLIPLKINSISKFNATDFKIEMAKRVSVTFPFIQSTNARSALEVTACEVVRSVFGYVDLGSSVCVNTCNDTVFTKCPVGVVRCKCNNVNETVFSQRHRHHRYDRDLQQGNINNVTLETNKPSNASTTSPPSVTTPSPIFINTGAELQVELSFNLANVLGYAPTSEINIADTYASLGSVAATILKTDATLASSFGIDQNKITSRTAAATIRTQTPIPPPTTPSPPPPATPAPPTESPEPIISGSRSGRRLWCDSIAVVVMLVLSCMMLNIL
eukprot:PhF_6_TR38578/c0_g1_i1/m.57285